MIYTEIELTLDQRARALSEEDDNRRVQEGSGKM